VKIGDAVAYLESVVLEEYNLACYGRPMEYSRQDFSWTSDEFSMQRALDIEGESARSRAWFKRVRSDVRLFALSSPKFTIILDQMKDKNDSRIELEDFDDLKGAEEKWADPETLDIHRPRKKLSNTSLRAKMKTRLPKDKLEVTMWYCGRGTRCCLLRLMFEQSSKVLSCCCT
jgi:hypothetical protein